eukprot:GAHX01000496.1.p1 GENE.GAHX01000496.1~~GAHX01000496.1.p1  ORF type:complete len:233 (-),score=45.94 GAHX01000496.1:32-688(-)
MGNCSSAPDTPVVKEESLDYTGLHQKVTDELLPLYNLSVDPADRNELARRRKEFFGTRIEGNKEMWAALQSALESDDISFGDTVLKTAGLKPYEINHEGRCAYTYDEAGHKYEIPVFVFCAPSDLPLRTNKKNKTTTDKPKMVNIKLRFSNNKPDKNVKLMNNKYISDLITQVSETTKIQKSSLYIIQLGRLFSDNEILSEIKDGALVQVFVDNISQA